MNWTGGRFRRHFELDSKSKPRRRTFRGRDKACGPHQITLFNKNGGDGTGRANFGTPSSGTGPESRNRFVQSNPGSYPLSSKHTNAVSSPSSGPQTHPQHAPSPAPGPLSQLERAKRQLLEKHDWAAVGAARPVQVAFTAEEELQRFGKRRRLTKGDHKRLQINTAKAPLRRQRTHQDMQFEGAGSDSIPEDLEIRIDGGRLRQHYVDIDSNARPMSGGAQLVSQDSIISSQSMLLDEDSRCSYRGRPSTASKSEDASKNNELRGLSGLSMLSHRNGLQVDSSEVPFMPDLRLDNQRLPVIPHRKLSALMGTDLDLTPEGLGRAVEPLQVHLNGSTGSSIMPHPESPVRRRFTIDDQAIAERQGRFEVSSPMNEPKTGPRIRKLVYRRHGAEHDGSPEAEFPSPRPTMYDNYGPSMQAQHGGRSRNHRAPYLEASPRMHSFDPRSEPNNVLERLTTERTYLYCGPNVRTLQEGQLGYDESPKAILGFPRARPTQAEFTLGSHGQLNDRPESMPTYSWLNRLPQVHQRAREQVMSKVQMDKPPVAQTQPRTSYFWLKNAREYHPLRTCGHLGGGMHHPAVNQHAETPSLSREDHTINTSSVLVYGQPVVLEGCDVLAAGHTTRHKSPDTGFNEDDT